MITAAEIFNNIRYTTFSANTKFEKMPAAIQRELFGKAVFGKKSVKWNAARKIIITHVTTISRDYDTQEYTLEEVAKLVNDSKFAEKGYNGYGYKYGRSSK